MRDIAANQFIVYPENRKILSGKMNFLEKSHHKLNTALAGFTIALVGALFLLTLYSAHVLDTALFLNLGAFVVILAIVSAFGIREALMMRRLDEGEFIDGQIVNSEVYWDRQGWNVSTFSLQLTYTFTTPAGITISRTVNVKRPDLWEQAPQRFKGFGAAVRRAKRPEELQELAPPANTPVKVRYVNDDLFRVM